MFSILLVRLRELSLHLHSEWAYICEVLAFHAAFASTRLSYPLSIRPSTMIIVPFPAIFLGVTLISITSVNALGINCRGSSLCPDIKLASNYILQISKIATGTAFDCNSEYGFICGPMFDTDIYAPGARIVCLPQGKSFLGGICAFTQGNVASLGTYGVVIKRKLKELSEHGCEICGSVPIGDRNDPNEAGILTVNYVGGVVCAGLCPPTHYRSSLSQSANTSSLPFHAVNVD